MARSATNRNIGNNWYGELRNLEMSGQPIINSAPVPKEIKNQGVQMFATTMSKIRSMFAGADVVEATTTSGAPRRARAAPTQRPAAKATPGTRRRATAAMKQQPTLTANQQKLYAAIPAGSGIAKDELFKKAGVSPGPSTRTLNTLISNGWVLDRSGAIFRAEGQRQAA